MTTCSILLMSALLKAGFIKAAEVKMDYVESYAGYVDVPDGRVWISFWATNDLASENIAVARGYNRVNEDCLIGEKPSHVYIKRVLFPRA